MVQLLGEDRIGAVRIDVQLMRKIPAHLVVTQGSERGVAGLGSSFSAAEGVRGRRSYLSRAETYPAEQVSDSAGQSGYGVHRVHNHICGCGHRTDRTRGQRLDKYAAVAHAVERFNRGNLGKP